MFPESFDDDTVEGKSSVMAVPSNKADTKGRPSLRQEWHQFLADVTMHGVRIAGDRDSSWIRRGFWGLLVISLGISVCVTASDLIIMAIDPPIQTISNLILKEIQEFPAVTICNQNSYRKSYISEHPEHLPLLSATFPDKFMRYMNKTAPQHNESEVISGNVTAIYIEAAHDLPNNMFTCYWKEKTKECPEIFRPVITEHGVCYTFNNDGALKVTRPVEGLKVHIAVEQKEYTFGPNDGVSGVKVFVHSAGEFPLNDEIGFNLAPGTSSQFNLQRVSSRLSDRRGCVTDHSKAYPGCHLRVVDQCVFDKCGCRLFYHKAVAPVCNTLNSTKCAKSNEETCDQEFRASSNKHGCGLPCDIVTYVSRMTYGGFPHSGYLQRIKEMNLTHFLGMSEAEIRADLLSIEISYESMIELDVTQVDAYGWGNILGDIGGQLGLFLGASILTLVEYLEFFLFKVVFCGRSPCTSVPPARPQIQGAT